jgi:hypothetical protein
MGQVWEFRVVWDFCFSHWWGRAIDQRVLAPWRMQGASRKMPVGSQSWANVGFQFRDHSSTASQQQSIGTEVPPSLSIPQAQSIMIACTSGCTGTCIDWSPFLRWGASWVSFSVMRSFSPWLVSSCELLKFQWGSISCESVTTVGKRCGASWTGSSCEALWQIYGSFQMHSPRSSVTANGCMIVLWALRQCWN